MNKKEKKKGGEYFRLPTLDLELRLSEYESQLKIAGEMEDFESIAVIAEQCEDIIHVLNIRHMGKYIFPQAMRAFDTFHEMKLNGKLAEAVDYLESLTKMKREEIAFITEIQMLVLKELSKKEGTK